MNAFFRVGLATTLRTCRPVTVGLRARTLATAAKIPSQSQAFRSSFARPAGGVLAAVAAVGLTAAFYKPQEVHCQEPPVVPPPRDPLPPPPASSVNMYELSFGTVCGICAGVFLKKGAKAMAFLFGGVFVLLQYFNSLSLIRIDWRLWASRFETLFYSKPTEPGAPARPPTLYSLYTWFIDFLTANFQQRASFIAGFALGLRLG